jgi:hypothetical protein
MPSLDDLPGRVPLLDASAFGLPPFYDTLRRYLDPSHFLALIPQFQEFERGIAASRDPSGLASAPPGRNAASAGNAPGPDPDVDPSAPAETYEDLRPYLRPSLFEALKPHIAAFEQMNKSRGDAASAVPAAPTTPSPAQSFEEMRPFLRASLFEALKPQWEQYVASQKLRGPVVGPQNAADPAITLASYDSPRPARPLPGGPAQTPSGDPSPAPSAPGGTSLSPDQTASAPVGSVGQLNAPNSNVTPLPATGALVDPSTGPGTAPAPAAAASTPSQEFSPGDVDPLTNNPIRQHRAL